MNGLKNPWNKKAPEYENNCKHFPSQPRVVWGASWKNAHRTVWLRKVITNLGVWLHYQQRRRIAAARRSPIDAFRLFWFGAVASFAVLVFTAAICTPQGWRFFPTMLHAPDSVAFPLFASLCISGIPFFYGTSAFFSVLIHIGWFGGDRWSIWRIMEAAATVIAVYALIHAFNMYSIGPGHFEGLRMKNPAGSLEDGFDKWVQGIFSREIADGSTAALLVTAFITARWCCLPEVQKAFSPCQAWPRGWS